MMRLIRASCKSYNLKQFNLFVRFFQFLQMIEKALVENEWIITLSGKIDESKDPHPRPLFSNRGIII